MPRAAPVHVSTLSAHELAEVRESLHLVEHWRARNEYRANVQGDIAARRALERADALTIPALRTRIRILEANAGRGA